MVAPRTAYCVTGGVRTDLDLLAVPSLTPRQTRILAGDAVGIGGAGGGSAAAVASSRAGPPEPSLGGSEHICNAARHTTLRESDAPYQFASREAWRRRRRRLATYARMLEEEEGPGWHERDACPWPSWQARLRAPERHRAEGDSSIIIDHP